MNSARFYNQFQKTTQSLRRRATGNVVSEKIFFLHIPKCGGTSVDSAIMEAYAWKSCLRLDSAASRKAASAQDEELMHYRNSLLPYFMEQNGLRYISGHFSFNAKLHSRYSPHWRYVTVLRHPVQKYISQYFYNLQKTDADHFGIEESLSDFIDTEEGTRLGQDMVQKITGTAEVTTPGSAEREAQIQLALRNIEKFQLVGILEDLQQFEKDFKKKFGVSILIKKKNRNKRRDDKQLSHSIRKKIEQHCRPDITLYEHVKKMNYG